jgi:hypothetical protein
MSGDQIAVPSASGCFGAVMNNETQRIMEALMLIYGSDLQAATITVLLKDGDTAVRFITQTLPQRETAK